MTEWQKASEIPDLVPRRTEPPPIPGSAPPQLPYKERPWKLLEDETIGTRKAQTSPPEPEKKRGFSGWLIAIVIGLLALGIGKAVGVVGGEAITKVISASTRPTLQQGLAASVVEIKKRLPIRIDELTQFTDVSVTGTTIFYVYTIDPKVRQELVEANEQMLLNTNQTRTCKEPATRSLIEQGATMAWQYRLNGRNVFTSKVSSCP